MIFATWTIAFLWIGGALSAQQWSSWQPNQINPYWYGTGNRGSGYGSGYGYGYNPGYGIYPGHYGSALYGRGYYGGISPGLYGGLGSGMFGGFYGFPGYQIYGSGQPAGGVVSGSYGAYGLSGQRPVAARVAGTLPAPTPAPMAPIDNTIGSGGLVRQGVDAVGGGVRASGLGGGYYGSGLGTVGGYGTGLYSVPPRVYGYGFQNYGYPGLYGGYGGYGAGLYGGYGSLYGGGLGGGLGGQNIYGGGLYGRGLYGGSLYGGGPYGQGFYGRSLYGGGLYSGIYGYPSGSFGAYGGGLGGIGGLYGGTGGYGSQYIRKK